MTDGRGTCWRIPTHFPLRLRHPRNRCDLTYFWVLYIVYWVIICLCCKREANEVIRGHWQSSLVRGLACMLFTAQIEVKIGKKTSVTPQTFSRVRQGRDLIVGGLDS